MINHLYTIIKRYTRSGHHDLELKRLLYSLFFIWDGAPKKRRTNIQSSTWEDYQTSSVYKLNMNAPDRLVRFNTVLSIISLKLALLVSNICSSFSLSVELQSELQLHESCCAPQHSAAVVAMARLPYSLDQCFRSHAPSLKRVCFCYMIFLIHSTSHFDTYCTFTMAPPNGEYVTPSISGVLDTQNTVISQHSHMQKARTGLSYSSMYPIDNAAQGRHREPKPGAEDNVQPRFELFLLADGEKKVTEEHESSECSHYVHSCPSSTQSKITFSEHI